MAFRHDLFEIIDEFAEAWSDRRIDITHGDDASERLGARFLFVSAFLMNVAMWVVVGLVIGLFGALGFLSTVILCASVLCGIMFWILIWTRSYQVGE